MKKSKSKLIDKSVTKNKDKYLKRQPVNLADSCPNADYFHDDESST